jgi:hypothetical protein
MRASALALVATLAACEPGFPLPTVHGPSATWSAPRPPTDGPCLQTTRVRKHTYLWNRGIEMPGSFEAGLVGATFDDRAAHALVVRGVHEDRAAIATALLSNATLWAGAIALDKDPRHDDKLALGLTFGTLSISGFAGAIALAVRSGEDESRALAVYNADCRR